MIDDVSLWDRDRCSCDSESEEDRDRASADSVGDTDNDLASDGELVPDAVEEYVTERVGDVLLETVLVSTAESVLPVSVSVAVELGIEELETESVLVVVKLRVMELD